jgi:hypothetical protein
LAVPCISSRDRAFSDGGSGSPEPYEYVTPIELYVRLTERYLKGKAG